MSSRTILANVEVCVFDAYGTIFDLGDLVRRAQSRLGATAEALMALWRRKQLEYSWVRSLAGRHSDFWHVTGESLDYAMAALGLRDVALRASLMEAWLTPKVFSDVPAVMARLKEAGLQTAILSNGSPSMLVAGASSSGLSRCFDALLSVEKAGIFKPHPAVYKLVTEHFEVDDKAVCFMSANGWDLAGAAMHGFRAVRIDRDGSPADILPGQPEASISTLADLVPLLGLQ